MLDSKDIPFHSAPFVWFVVGGWALDLFLGRQTRQHADIDLGVFRNDQLALQRFLADWSFSKMVRGDLLEWEKGERLILPTHEVHGRSPSGQEIEILFSESDSSNWIYRRQPEITLPISAAIIEIRPGLRVLAPEIVMLFKSKNPRKVDQSDFDNVLPNLSTDQAHWLRNALERTNNLHDWIGRLSQVAGS